MTKEFIGANAIESLSGIILKHSPAKIFLVTGGKSFEASGAKSKLDEIIEGIESYRHFGFEENPKFHELLTGAEKLKKFNPDMIIAIGGGSVLDTAKIISILPVNEAKAIDVITGKSAVDSSTKPVVLIPTTSGSGSEATHFAVAYINDKKYSVADQSLLPDYTILDSSLTYSTSPYQTAVSGMDALCQAIESYWAKGSTNESKEYAKEAINLVISNIRNAVNHSDIKARGYMMIGSNLAGKAINISKTTAPHALSYAITTKFGIPHGHAVAMILPHFFNLNFSCKDVDNRIMTEVFSFMNCSSPENAKEYFQKIMSDIGLQTNIFKDDFNVSTDIVQELADAVNLERLKNHVYLPSKEDILTVLSSIIV